MEFVDGPSRAADLLMDVDELFRHALEALPEAVGDLLRAERDPADFVFASFDGASTLGTALIASDVATEKNVETLDARGEVSRMVEEATSRGEELMVSLMITKDILRRILNVANLDEAARTTVHTWLATPLATGHFRVVAIADNKLRAAAVDGLGPDEDDEAPISSSLLN